MKKYRLKQIIIIMLALMMITETCACSRNRTDTPVKEENVNSAMAREHVYRICSKEILPWIDGADCEDSALGVMSAICTDEGVCAVLELRDWLAEKAYYGVLTADGALSDLQITPLALPEDTPGTAVQVDGTEGAAEDADNNEAMIEEINYVRFAIAPDQRIYGLRSVNRSYEDADTGEYREDQLLGMCCWDVSGKLLWASELAELNRDRKKLQNFQVRGIYAAADGSANLLFSADQEYRIPIGREGEISAREALSGQAQKIFSNYCGMWPGKDGVLQVLYSDDQNGETAYLLDYDINGNKLGEPYELPLPYNWFSWGIKRPVSAGKDSDLVYADVDGIWTYRKGDEQGTFRMNYINSDINVTGLDVLLEMDAERFCAVYREAGERAMQIGVFTYVEPEKVAEKQVIVLGGSNLDELLRQRVVAFNRASDTYRVVLKQYDYDENSHSFLQLNLDIAAGNMPDILMAEELPMDGLIRKGLIADIRPLIRQDAELSQKEFMENVFDAYSVDGKLLYVVPDFSMVTMVAKTSLVGGGNGWTMERAKQVLAGMGKDAQILSEITRDVLLEKAMRYSGRNFVDVATGKCAFDSEEFIALMEFAATLPEEFDRDAYDGDYWDDYEAQYRDNRTLLMELYINTMFSSLNYELNGYMGEPYTFVGFPGISGNMTESVGHTDSADYATSAEHADSAEHVASAEHAASASGADSAKGAYLFSDHLMALSAKSSNLEGAWAFARYYLTDDYQRSLEWSLPVDKKIFMEQTERLTERPYYYDENGEKVELDDTISYHGEDVTIPRMSQKQAEELISYVGSVNTAGFVNEDVMAIVREEMESYFSGQKPAKDVADIIQNRVQLVLKESQ